MNALRFRRRWLIARPWIIDGIKLLWLGVLVMASMALLSNLSQLCVDYGLCQP